MKNISYCPICGNKLICNYSEWHLYCTNCKYERSTFNPSINTENAHEKVDEESREKALKQLRKINFKKLLTEIIKYKSSGKLLDIGSAHGWFLQMASEQFNVTGIEPDQYFYSRSLIINLNVRLGYFPEILEKDEKFDIIIFNDVLEHIPDVISIIRSCYNHLNKNGLLVLNLPNSKGLVYNFSKFLYNFGIQVFFERLWQKDLPSPHLHYFNLTNLQLLLEENHFKVIRSGKLKSINLKGLWERISFIKEYSIITKITLFFLGLISIPFIKVFRSDIIYVIATIKHESSSLKL